MKGSLVVPSLFARATVQRQQEEFTDGWDPLINGYTAAFYFHTFDIKINSCTTQAKKNERLNASKIRGSGHLENARSGELEEY